MKQIANLFIVVAVVILLVAAISRVTLVPVLGVPASSLVLLTNTLILLGITIMLLEQQKK